MILLILGFVLDYLIMSVLLGVFIWGLFGKKLTTIRPLYITMLFILLFIAYDFGGWIIVYELDIKYIIGNEQLAELFGLKGFISASELYEIDWYKIFIYLFQSLIAYYIGLKFYARICQAQN